MRILIIEDEIPAAERLITHIKQCDPNADIQGPLDSNQSIIDWFKKNEEPALIFSDIELLDGSVFYSLEHLRLTIPIIFTTAYDQYTLKAFEASGISYLTKPFELEDIQKAFNKFSNLRTSFLSLENERLIQTLKEFGPLRKQTFKTRLSTKIDGGIYLLKVEEVSCIRTENGQAFAFTSKGQQFPISELIGDLEEQLDPKIFFRINRGELVNVNFITRIENYFNDRLAIRLKGQKSSLISSAAKTSGFRKWVKGI